ncbi:6285_t:CDS:2, partial [Cetraspora pellucida]
CTTTHNLEIVIEENDQHQITRLTLENSVDDLESLQRKVLSRAQNLLRSGFQYTCDEIKSNVEPYLSVTINTCYQQVFETKTEYSDLAAIGFENKDIIKELIANIESFPIFLQIFEKHNIVITSIGDIDKDKFNGVGTGFVSSFTALKDNQKLGNRGGTRIKKNIKTILEGFFLNGNRNDKDKISTKAMHAELLEFVKNGNIEAEDIPKTSTIQNWINSYTWAFKQKAAEKKLGLTIYRIYTCNISQIQ